MRTHLALHPKSQAFSDLVPKTWLTTNLNRRLFDHPKWRLRTSTWRSTTLTRLERQSRATAGQGRRSKTCCPFLQTRNQLQIHTRWSHQRLWKTNQRSHTHLRWTTTMSRASLNKVTHPTTTKYSISAGTRRSRISCNRWSVAWTTRCSGCWSVVSTR